MVNTRQIEISVDRINTIDISGIDKELTAKKLTKELAAICDESMAKKKPTAK